MTFDNWQKIVDEYINQFKEGYFPVFENLARLTEEVGELAKEISHEFGNKKKKETEKSSTISEEIGDILFIITCLSNQLDLNFDEIAIKTIEKYQTRDKNRWTRKN